MVSPIVNAETFIPLLHTEMVDAVSVLLFIFTLLVSASLFCKALFSRNKQRSKDIKHLTTASEIKSCHGHLVQKHKPQEMITQYACNKPASWPLHIRLSAAKTRFTQSKFRMLHVLHCVVLVTFTVQADSQGHVSHYHELMSRVWPVNAYFMQWLSSTKTALRFFLSLPWKLLRWLFKRASGLPNTSEYFPSEISFTCSLVQSAPTEAADIPRATKEVTWSFIRATSGTTTKQTEHTSSLSLCSK